MKLDRSSRLFSVSIALSLLGSSLAFGQVNANEPMLGERFSLEAIPHFRRGMDALPKIVGPQTPEVKRVNAALSAMNRKTLESLGECDAEARSYFAAQEPKAQAKVSGDWIRRVTVTMNGPRYVSMIADESQTCTGAYPLNSLVPIVFDMNTGERVDWKSLSPPETAVFSGAEQSPDGTSSPGLLLPPLMNLAVFRATADCRQAMQDFDHTGQNSGLPFVVWPDATQGVLMIKATGLPHVVQACEKRIGLTIAQARKLGFSEELLGSIERAHRAVLSNRRKPH